MAKLLHNLVEEVLSFDLSGLTSKLDRNCLQKWEKSDTTMKNMLIMLMLKILPNHSKSLILGSSSWYSSNFSIFEKNNSNLLMLQAVNPQILWNVPHLHSSKDFLILILHTFGGPLDWPFTSVLTSQTMHDNCSGPPKKIHNSWLPWKLSITKILERCLLVAQMVFYKSSMTLHPYQWHFMP